MKRLGPAQAEALFVGFLEGAGYAAGSVRSKIGAFRSFLRTLPPDTDLRDLDQKTLSAFLHSLVESGASPSTAKNTASVLRLFYRLLCLHGHAMTNPARGLSIRLEEKDRVRTILTMEEVARFLDSIDPSTWRGLRDRALFELLYSSGLRSGEASALLCEDIDLAGRLVLVRHAKNKRDRIVPVTKAAAQFLALLLSGRTRSKAPLFPGGSGGRLQRTSMNRIFQKRLMSAGLWREGLSVHSLRHSCATHLLCGGADLRYVQELLGHESIESTAVYTHELLDSLKRIYKTYHPRENDSFREVDEAYMKRLEDLERSLLAAKEKRDGRRRAASGTGSG